MTSEKNFGYKPLEKPTENWSLQTTDITKNLDAILDQVFTTKLKKNAKGVIMTCVEFIIVTVFIIFQEINKVQGADGSISVGLKTTTLISALYVAGIAIFVFIHALVLPDSAKVNPDLVKAYQKTNNIPVVDSLLEIPIAVEFKGPMWWLIWIFWGFFAIVGLVLIVLVNLFVDFDLENSTYAAVTLAIVELYEITGDFAEYWILTRNMNEDVAMPQRRV